MLKFKLTEFATEQAVSSIIWFVEMWAGGFPKCEDSKNLLTEIKESAEKQKIVSTWHAAMSLPLDPKYAKYTPALHRILDEEPTCYIACEYRDHTALFKSVNLGIFDKMKLCERYSELEDSTTRAEVWKLIQTINKYVLDACDATPQRVPTRDEIKDNIREHKLSKLPSANPSMHKAFQLSIINIAEALSDEPLAKSLKERAEAITDTELAEICKQWGEISSQIDGGIDSKNVEQCAHVDWPFFTSEEKSTILEHILSNSKLSNILKQMSSYCCVQQNIPSNMMGRIENYAQKLAHDISSGNKSLETLDLNRIGEEVLQGCDSSEMAQLANNIGNILPTLNTLRSGLTS